MIYVASVNWNLMDALRFYSVCVMCDEMKGPRQAKVIKAELIIYYTFCFFIHGLFFFFFALLMEIYSLASFSRSLSQPSVAALSVSQRDSCFHATQDHWSGGVVSIIGNFRTNRFGKNSEKLHKNCRGT